MTNKRHWVKNLSLCGVLAFIFSVFLGSCTTLGETVSSDWPDLRIKSDKSGNSSSIRSVALNNDFLNAPLELYIEQKENVKILRFRAVHSCDSANDGLSLNKAVLTNDQGGNSEYSFDISAVNRNVISGGGFRETADIAFSSYTAESSGIGQHSEPQKIKTLLELLNGTNIKLRLSGDKYSDYNISEAHIAALKNILMYYVNITAKIE